MRRILRGEDDRLLVIVGPCSIHDPQAAVEYATRLRDAATQRQDTLLPVMRVYFEKPRTRMGWKGLIYDPDLDGAGDIAKGLRAARGLLLECAAQEVPAASEILDLVTPQYYAELLSWGAIGARTVESPLHRQMASALSAPVGFKNATHGGIDVAIDAIHVAQQAHRFPSISMEGRAIVVSTTGNPDGHLVLRGAHGGPNHDAASVAKAAQALASSGLRAAPVDRLQPRQQRQGLPASAAGGGGSGGAGGRRQPGHRGRAARKPSLRRQAGDRERTPGPGLRPERHRRLHRLGADSGRAGRAGRRSDAAAARSGRMSRTAAPKAHSAAARRAEAFE